MSTSTPRRPQRYDQCDDTCTTDCGHCKGRGRPADLARDMADGLATFFTPTRDNEREVRS